jgi:deoxyribodipyrimidine photo-lyase
VATAVVWIRRDLRLDDNVALFAACRDYDAVCLAFVVNEALLAQPSMSPALVCAFFDALSGLRESLRKAGGELVILSGAFPEELTRLVKRVSASALYYNVDYEPSAIARDAAVESALVNLGVTVKRFTDHVYFGADEILRAPDSPLKVFTPYKRRWLEMRAVAPRMPVPSSRAVHGKLLPAQALGDAGALPAPEQYGFVRNAAYLCVNEAAARQRLDHFLRERIHRYATDRDYPALSGTSTLSADLRAGTIGIRTCVERAVERACDLPREQRESAMVWVSELIWRDFYQMVLSQYPEVVTSSFQAVGDRIPWRDATAEFDAWCSGVTGYPIVDAAMRQLNTTGWMHNRLRMIVASFLTKHLLIDWRRGALYFEQHLIDADVAANNGGWQWAASTGTDAVPYFRIFNPTAQGQKYDPNGDFVVSMIPELANVPRSLVHEPWSVLGSTYPHPIVDHRIARERALATFQSAKR